MNSWWRLRIASRRRSFSSYGNAASLLRYRFLLARIPGKSNAVMRDTSFQNFAIAFHFIDERQYGLNLHISIPGSLGAVGPSLRKLPNVHPTARRPISLLQPSIMGMPRRSCQTPGSQLPTPETPYPAFDFFPPAAHLHVQKPTDLCIVSQASVS